MLQIRLTESGNTRVRSSHCGVMGSPPRGASPSRSSSPCLFLLTDKASSFNIYNKQFYHHSASLCTHCSIPYTVVSHGQGYTFTDLHPNRLRASYATSAPRAMRNLCSNRKDDARSSQPSQGHSSAMVAATAVKSCSFHQQRAPQPSLPRSEEMC